MIVNHKKARELFAENGHELTPAEAKEICDGINEIAERLMSNENFLAMDDEAIEEMLERDNKNHPDNYITLEEYKEMREWISDIWENDI